eukprot:9374673-Alexandrium_andersonii.AAC.1
MPCAGAQSAPSRAGAGCAGARAPNRCHRTPVLAASAGCARAGRQLAPPRGGWRHYARCAGGSPPRQGCATQRCVGLPVGWPSN